VFFHEDRGVVGVAADHEDFSPVVVVQDAPLDVQFLEMAGRPAHDFPVVRLWQLDGQLRREGFHGIGQNFTVFGTEEVQSGGSRGGPDGKLCVPAQKFNLDHLFCV